MTPEVLTVVALFVFGLVFGSFANVVIWRVPRGESISFPGSHCLACGNAVRWYDNIPIVSWLVLRGRCRDCSAPISARYLLVEAASGLLFALVGLVWGFDWKALFGVAFVWLLLVLSVIDLENRRLPNVLVGTLAGIGLIGAGLSQFLNMSAVPLTGLAASGVLAHPLGNALVGALIGVGFSGGTAVLYSVIRRVRGLGMGDIKFLGALGLFLGPYVLMALLLGSLLGMIVGLAGAKNRRLSEVRIPFGPWLAAGALAAAFAGPGIFGWYLGLVAVA